MPGQRNGGGRAPADRAGARRRDAPFGPVVAFGLGGIFAEELMRRIAVVTESAGKPIVTVPSSLVRRRVFPAFGRYASVILPSPPSVVAALTGATWYATHSNRRGGSGATASIASSKS